MQTRLWRILHAKASPGLKCGILFLALTSLPVFSEDPKDSQPAGQTPEPETSRQTAGNATPEFTPTEEISEDLSVPFPVDI